MTTVGRWSPNKVRKRILDGTWVAADEALGGMVLMTPTSIASTGSGNSSSIGTNGSVTFTACATLSLNGVFTSSYDNYMIAYSASRIGATNDYIICRLRASGTDASGTNYTQQYLYADSTTLGAARTSSATSAGFAFYTRESNPLGTSLFVYGPNLAQATAMRTIGMGWNGTNPNIYDLTSTHAVSSAYDGITIFSSGATVTLTGLVSVYGLGG